MTPVGRRDVLWDWLWLLAWGSLSSLWCLTAAQQIGATFDEPFYMRAGLEFWRTGSHGSLLRFGTMPLPVDVTTLPLFLWELGNGTALTPQDLEHVLPLQRLGTLAFWFVLLVYVMQIGKLLGGSWAGRIGVALVATQPSMIAHAGLATTDIAITATLLAFVYHFYTGREQTWRRRVALPGVLFGLALTAKASAIVYGPLCMIVLEAERLVRSGSLRAPTPGWWSYVANARQQTRSLRRDGMLVLCLGFVVCFIYCGCDWKPLPSFVRWAESLPEGRLHDLMVWLAQNLAIFHNAGEAFARQIGHNVRGHGVFLLGQTDQRSFWYYFPVALTMKVTVPLLILIVAVGLVRPRTLVNWACLLAGALLLHSLTARVQIGIRFMLPLIALTCVGLGVAVVHAWPTLTSRWHRQLLKGGLIAGVAWSAANCAFVWPHGLCYVNELWGGTASGYQCLSDSNYDWGQGLPELARWQQERNIETIDVCYFGADPRMQSGVFRPLPLHTLPIQTFDDLEPHVRGRYVAVSTTLLYGSYRNGNSRASEILRTLPASDRTQTYIIYDFTKMPDTIAGR